MRKNYFIAIKLLLLVFIINGCGETFNMPTKRKPLSGEWLTAIKLKPDEFTAYVAQHPMKLENVIIKNESISKSTINGAEFINTDWDNSFAKAATITNTVFKDGDIYHTSFARSTLTNVVFENMTLEKAEFVNAKLINVTFKNCKIYDSNLKLLHMSKIVIENSELKDVSFFESQLDITLLNTKVLESGRFMGLKPGSKVTIKDSYIGPYSEFDSSELSSFSVTNSTIDSAKMNFATVDEIIIKNSNLYFTIAGGKYNNVSFINIENSIILGDSTFNSLSIEDCKKETDVHLTDNTFKKLSIRNCPVAEFDMSDSKGERLQLSQIQVNEANFSKLIVKELVLTDFTITNVANFQGALAEDSQVTNFKIETGAKVKMDGTNIQFQ